MREWSEGEIPACAGMTGGAGSGARRHRGDSRLRGNDVGAGKPLPRVRARELRYARARVSVVFCRILSIFAGASGELMIADCRLSIDDWGLQGGSLGCGLDGLSVVFRFRIVRRFCFVKCGAREIPACAGMTKGERE